MKSRNKKALADVFMALFSMTAAVLVAGTLLNKMGILSIHCSEDSESDNDLSIHF